MKPLYYEHSMGGSYGAYKLEIKVETSLTQEQLQDSDISEATYQAADLIKKAVLGKVIANDPKAQQRAIDERKAILDLFSGLIYAKEIPNGYCSDYCCKHLPWFIVTTNIGDFKIGWRKSVMHIEWTDTTVKKTAEELFPNEDVTKSDRMIHAWGYDKAKQYIETIYANKS